MRRYYVVRIELSQALPEPFGETVWWAKCDMIATVGFHRLDLFGTNRDQNGKRKYLHPMLSAAEFASVQDAVLAGLGLGT
jgi:mRNA interferase MazF